MQKEKKKGDCNIPLISVVLPVYNVAPYLDKCINTLISQTYQNYEIILVDDGSTDESGKMCDVYAVANEKVRVFHKTNGGQSDARNYGVSRSLGEYIVFVDPDDYVSNDYLEYLIDLKCRLKSDIAVAQIVNGTGDDYNFNMKSKKEIRMQKENALSVMLYGKLFSVSPGGKIYPKNMVLSHPFPEGVLYEDLATIYKMVEECNYIAYGEKEVYFYRRRESSTRLQKPTEKHLYGLIIAKQVLVDMKKYPMVIPSARYRCAMMAIEYIPNILSGSTQDKKLYKKLKRELQPFYRTTVMDHNVPIISKIRCTAVMMGYIPTVCCWKIFIMLKKMVSYAQNQRRRV